MASASAWQKILFLRYVRQNLVMESTVDLLIIAGLPFYPIAFSGFTSGFYFTSKQLEKESKKPPCDEFNNV